MALRSGGQEFAYVGGVLETFVISGIYEYRMIINAKAGGNLNLDARMLVLRCRRHFGMRELWNDF